MPSAVSLPKATGDDCCATAPMNFEFKDATPSNAIISSGLRWRGFITFQNLEVKLVLRNKRFARFSVLEFIGEGKKLRDGLAILDSRLELDLPRRFYRGLR